MSLKRLVTWQHAHSTQHGDNIETTRRLLGHFTDIFITENSTDTNTYHTTRVLYVCYTHFDNHRKNTDLRRPDDDNTKHSLS